MGLSPPNSLSPSSSAFCQKGIGHMFSTPVGRGEVFNTCARERGPYLGTASCSFVALSNDLISASRFNA